MFDTEIAILIGAGASIPANVPGMVGMARGFRDQFPKSSQVRRAYQEIVGTGASEDLEEILQLCNRILELKERKLKGLLEAAIAPQSGARLKTFRKRFSVRSALVEDLRDNLIRWIRSQCLQFDRQQAQTIFGELIRVVAEGEVPVFTTNYDGVLDYVAANQGIPVADNFKRDSFGREYWDETHGGFLDHGLRIVKMHGSIYWHVTEDGKTIEKFRQPADQNAEGQRVSQLLIFPTRFKDIYQQNYFPLYSSFTRTIGSARLLLIIGHSLRDEYLLAAIRERLREPDFRLLLVDVRLPPAVRELCEIAKDRVLHLRTGVEEVVPLLCRAISSERANAFEYLSEAESAMRRGRKPKLGVQSGLPRYVHPGQKVHVRLRLETTSDVYTWAVALYRDRKWVRLFASSRGRSGRIYGFGEEEVDVSFSVPGDVQRGTTYTLSFMLLGSDGKLVAKQRRKLTIRKTDRGESTKDG